MNKLKNLREKAKILLASNNQQTTDRLFNRMEVGTAESKLSESAPYQQWSKAVFKNYKNSEAAEVAIFTTLAAHYDDIVLAKLLTEAQQFSLTQSIAKQLENIQFESWMKNEKTSEQIYRLLKLDAEEGNLLKNPLLSTWISYVTKLKTENPYELLLGKLTKIYNEEDITRLLLASEQDFNVLLIVHKLKDTRFKNWLDNGNSADDIFKLLHLNTKEGNDLLTSPRLSTWFDYVWSLKKNPNELLFSELKTRYTEEGLAAMILAAKKDPKANYYVSGLTEAQIKDWLRTGKTMDDAFKLLRLNKAEGSKLFSNAGWGTWESYATKIDKTKVDELMFPVLKKHYGDEGLTNIIVKTKEDINTKDIASRLQEEMWWSQGKSSDDVFNLLKLDEAGNNIFKSPEFSPALVDWVSYVNKLNKKKPDDFTGISDLESRFVAAVKRLQELQFKQWMTEKFMDPKVVSSGMQRYMDDPRSVNVILSFRDFYRANGGSPFH